MNIPELLAPAGSPESLRAALHFGADAVYGGMKRFGLRAFAGNFDEDQLREAVALCHAAGARFYLTMNIFPWDDELDDFVAAARFARDTGVDAVIVSDLGAICLLREEVPDLPVHVSTQASTINARAVRHYHELGCERVILAREISMERIGKLRALAPREIELETFVHGASCMAWSGRCLLSAGLSGRNGNRGTCAQPCRWKYAVVEEKRPGEYFPVSEDEHGTYVFSARDLNLMPILPELCATGVSSLKIEGRMKTEYYVAVTVGAYRRALDLLRDGGEEAFRAELPGLLDELRCASHRLSDTGFLLGEPEHPGMASGFSQRREYAARCLECAPAGEVSVFELKNRFSKDDPLELMTAAGVKPFACPAFTVEKTGETVESYGIAGDRVLLRLPWETRVGDMLRGPVHNHSRDTGGK
ncbi:MAG: U32 family peptidase [Clostridia bacterium]|nr:U32 family peptidase [Clostridia bacterium]